MTHRTIHVNGLHMHIAEEGEGPLVILLHGWPELWYSYRSQLEALAAAGYHAVAPDQRGFGQSDAPAAVEDYTLLHTAGDVVGLIAALGEKTAVVVGHDWGSPVASAVGLFRPDIVRGVVLLSVPYLPRGDVDMLTGLTATLGPHNYQVFFQERGVAEQVLEHDVERSVRGALIGASGDAPVVNTLADVSSGELFAGVTPETTLPTWLREEDVAYYVGQYTRTGYRGGLEWYRNSERTWELMAAWHGAPLLAPSLFICGDRDPVYHWPGMKELMGALREVSMPNLTRSVILEGCGHWTQQERPAEVNELLVDFLEGLLG